jgi:starch synthase
MERIDFAIVHHANQFVITNGYRNREGLDDVLGVRGGRTGYRRIFELHRTYGIPFNLHLSGTLLEAILWHCPDVLGELKNLRREGLLDLVASCYGQNMMRFFGYDYNLRQLNEELALYAEHLAAEPGELKVFWPPERLWDTERLAPVLADGRLLNGGFGYVLLDDRLFYPATDAAASRLAFDEGRQRNVSDFYPCLISGGGGLRALPISRFVRERIPPGTGGALDEMEALVHWLAAGNALAAPAACDPIVLYGDDLEKSAGCCGWDPEGPARYEKFLQWLAVNPRLRPVKLNAWGSAYCDACQKAMEVGTFFEMSRHFGAGENYEGWYEDPKWAPYRGHYRWSEERVAGLAARGADAALIDLAWKQLLISGWETAWHTPSYGVHGDRAQAGEISPWGRTIASHSRHAAVIAEAAHWMKHKDAAAWAQLTDVDNDGELELILKNDELFAVFSPLHGGRLLYLFQIGGSAGKLVIGNPCDDWNWQEELNRYMRVPANHPGALAEAGHEDDRYEVTLTAHPSGDAGAVLLNGQGDSAALGLEKSLTLPRGGHEIEVTYRLPPGLANLTVEFGLSPDYLHLLRHGREALREHGGSNERGYANNGTAVWVRLADPASTAFVGEAGGREFGHGRRLLVRSLGSPFTLWLGSKSASP